MRHKIIVIAAKDPTLIDGGSESYLRAYGRAAIRAGYEPHHFSLGREAGLAETEFGVVHRVYSPFRPFRGLMVAVHQPFIVNAVNRFVGQSAGPHLLHSFGPWPGVGVAAAERLRGRGISAVPVVTAFGTYTHETRGKLRGLRAGRLSLTRLQHEWELLWTRATVDPNERRGYRGSLVLVNYDSVRQIIQRQFGNGISFAKMTYASEAAFRSSADQSDAPPASIAGLQPRDAPLIVAVSRHDPRKGIDVLLRALATLKRDGILFRACLVGGGILLDKHRDLARQFGLGDCTAIPGRVPDANDYLAHAEIFALPSLEEGSGSVSLLEALQVGAAVVASRIDGIPEDVTHEDTALLTEPGDESGLAFALRRLLADADLRARIGRAGRRLYLERFSAHAFAADIARVYTSLGFVPESTDKKAEAVAQMEEVSASPQRT